MVADPRKSNFLSVTGVCASLALCLCITTLSCGRKNSGSYANDIAFLSEKNIVISKWYGGVVASQNGGKTWSSAATIPILQFTVDRHGRLWGLYGWLGIHEDSKASLTYSDDGGQSWVTVNLDPAVVIPVAFISSCGEEPLLLASDGQLWAYTETSNEGWSAWSKLGKPVPETMARTGIKVKDTIYVASQDHIWLSEDGAVEWHGVPIQDIAAFASDNQACWCASRTGTVYRCKIAANDWRKVAQIAPIDHIFALAVKNDSVYAAAQASEVRAMVAIVGPDGRVTEFPGINGEQAVCVRVDPAGRVWCAAKGVYVLAESSWHQVWPVQTNAPSALQ